MIFNCPECQAPLRGEKPGTILACRRCSNPVVVPEPSPAPAPEAPSVDAPVDAPERAAAEPPDAGRLWKTAGIVVLILAVAHLGLFMLLTMDARAGMAEIEADYTRAELMAAKTPKAAPQPGTPAFGPWSRSVALWDKAEDYRVHARQVWLLRVALLASFLIQMGIIAWIMIGLLGRVRRWHLAEGRAR